MRICGQLQADAGGEAFVPRAAKTSRERVQAFTEKRAPAWKGR